jgi:hypothetical protein
MRIKTLIIVVSTCLIASQCVAQNELTPGEDHYHKFALYGGIGPSFFFNNVITFKNQVSPWGYTFSLRGMWEPEHSFLALGFETGYNRIYSASGTIVDSMSGQQTNAHVTNSNIPLLFVVSMKFSKNIYANWSMGQSISFNKVSSPGFDTNHDASTWSLADFSATLGYRFYQKGRISYAAELKGYYSSSYSNGTIGILFSAGYRL